MDISWKDVLLHYQSQNFQVFTRENLFHRDVKTVIPDLLVPTAPLNFLQNLSHPHLSIWEAFLMSVKSIHPTMQEKEVFYPLRDLLTHATQVAILYGEHFAWKSPDKWSYLFEVTDQNDQNRKHYIIAHTPATSEYILQAEMVLGIQLPASYVCFLKCTNGLGLALDELYYICGVGEGRAVWDTVIHFQTFDTSIYHEITSNWLEWLNTYEYELQREKETGLTTFLSDPHHYMPFSVTYDYWCFSVSPQSGGERAIFFWDHELREATYQYPDFETWFRNAVKYEE